MMGQQSPIVRLPTLDAMLTALPSLPRPVLSRLVVRMIEHLDALDGDPELEDSEACNHLVDERGRWCGRGPCPDGAWYEDDEDNGDLEATDEREPEDYDGGHSNPPNPNGTSMMNA